MTKMSIAGGLVALVIVGVACFFLGRSGQTVVHADKQEIAQIESRAAESIEGISNAWLKAKEVSDAQLLHAAESFGGGHLD